MVKLVTRAEKTEFIGLRLRPEIRRAIERAAKADNRPISQWIETIVIEKLRKDGYLK